MDARFVSFLVALFSWTSAQQLYCPGPATISCSTVTPIIWDGTAFNEHCPLNGISFQTINNDSIGESSFCGELNVTITNVVTTIDVGSTVVNVDSSLSFSAQPSLSGLTVVCRSGANAAVNSILLIPDPTQTVSVSQDSLTAVTVNLTGGDSRCVSLYFVEVTQMGSSDLPVIINSSSPSISVTGLDLCRNRYSVVSFVQASSGVQEGRSTPQMIGLEAVTNVTANTTTCTLSWTQPANSASDGCISGYIISWAEGEDTTVGSSISVLVSNLHNFPFCQSQTLTVTPNTPSGRLTVGTSLQNAIFEHPEFAAPVVSAFFTLQSDNVVININWQVISLEAVPLRMFGFSKIGEGVCNPQFSATGSSVTQSVPGAQSGDRYTVCVVFINNECMNRIDDTVRVLLANPQLSVGDSSVSIMVTVSPSPPMSPDSLSILATIDPPHASDVLANYPTLSQQYMVMFDGLTPGTIHTYNIRVILMNDSTTTIGLPVTGSFTVPACGTVCVTVVIVVSVLLLMVAALSLAGGFGAYKYKNKSKDWSVRSFKSENAEKHELTHSSSPPPPDSLYADPKSIEHQAAPGTEDQYAMVDKKGKKNTKPEPTPPEALYQDPSTIEHKTTASGAIYTVVDKAKRSSKKEGEPDVVPPASEGLTYAEIDLSSKPPKPGSGKQAPQQPGGNPVEHPVEYSNVEHSNIS